MPKPASHLPALPRVGLSLVAAATILSACTPEPLGGVPTPSPTGRTVTASEPPPEPSPSPTPRRYVEDFSAAPLGALPADFVDVTTEEQTPAWVYQGKWAVATDEQGNRVLLHDDVREQPAVSFVRYRGSALGTPNGQVPPVYYAETAMRPIRSPQNYPPTGDQGVQFFYLKYDTYLEVVIKPSQIEVWEANGSEPRTTKGWKRLWGKELITKAGTVRRVGALVNLQDGTFTAFLDGKELKTVKSTLLKPGPAWVALRGIGNVVSFDDMRIEPR